MRFLAILPLMALLAHAQPFSQSDLVFSQNLSPLLQGCVGAWRLEEASGTRYDLSGKNNNLTSNNSVGQAVGKVGNCATNVAASSQRLSIASNSTLAMSSTSFSICFWAYPTTVDTTTRWAIGKTTGFTTFEYYIFQDSSAGWQLIVSSDGTVGNRFGSGSIAATANAWQFIACWYDKVAQTINIQKDNGSVTSASYTNVVFASTNPVSLGATGDGATSHFFNGSLDEFSIWKRVLTSNERTGLYFAGLGTHTPWAHP